MVCLIPNATIYLRNSRICPIRGYWTICANGIIPATLLIIIEYLTLS